MVIAILTNNTMSFLVFCFGKIGYFPFFSLSLLIVYCYSYFFILCDQLVKVSYLFILYLCFNLNITNIIDFFLSLLNFLVLQVFIKFLLTFKHLVLISSIVVFIMIYLLIIIEDMLYSIIYLLCYFFNSLSII